MSDETRAVDINSVDLEEDVVEFNPEVDATEAAPPLDDGIYRVKPSFGDEGPNWQTKIKDGKPTSFWPKTQLRFTVVDGPEGTMGRALFTANSIMVSTMNRRNGGNVIATILNAMGLGDEVKQCRGHQELAKLFDQAVAQGRELRVETQWEARVKQADGTYKTVKTGQRNFPQNGSGKPDPVLRLKDEEVRAQARIVHFLPL